MFEYRLYDIPKKALSSEANPKKLVPELNELGSEGWHVVASLTIQPGIANQLLLQRAKTTPPTT